MVAVLHRQPQACWSNSPPQGLPSALSTVRAPRSHLGEVRYLLLALGVGTGIVGHSVRLRAQATRRAPDAIHLRVQEAERAVEEGRVVAWRAQWDAAHRQRPDVPLGVLLVATVDRVSYRGAKADSLYRRLSADSTVEPLVAAHASLGLGALAAQSYRLDVAVTEYRRAAERFAALRDSVGQADALAGLAFVAMRTQGVQDAAALLDRATRLAPAGARALQARLACTRATIRVRARVEVSDAEWRSVGRQSGDGGPRAVSQCLLARAQALDARGQGDSALAILDSLAVVQRTARIWSGLSSTRQWQGYQLVTLGRFSEAREALAEAIDIGTSSGSLSSAGWANLSLASLSQRIGAWGDADRYTARATGALSKAQDQVGLLFARRLRAENALLRGDLEQADSAFAALALDNESLSPQSLVSDLIARAEIARRQHRSDHATRLIDSAAQVAARRGMPGWFAELEYQRALLEMTSRRFDAASARLRTLLARERTLSAPAQFEVLSRIAESEAGANRLDSAEQLIRQATARADQWSQGLTHRDLVLTALQSRHIDWEVDHGLSAVIGALSRGGRPLAALELAEWRRGRLLQRQALTREALRGPAGRSARDVADAGADRVGQARADGAGPAAVDRSISGDVPPRGVVVVAFVVGADGDAITAFVRTADTLHSISLASIPDLTPLIGRFVAFLEAGRVLRPAARRLSAALIDPLLPLFPADTRRLVLVPDGALHRLPFSAVLLADGRYLGQRLELASAPSVAVAMRGLPSVLGVNDAGRRGVLAVGAPNRLPLGLDGHARWSPIPGASVEIRAIERLVSGSERLTGANMTADLFRRAVSRGGPVLHIATHADADNASLSESGLVFEPTASHDGILRAPALAALRLPFDLVVLSACESGEGMLLSGEGIQGLASAALEGGARAVVTTRWRLEDANTATIIASFYRMLIRGDDPVGALARLRRDAISRGESPAVWANLDFVGDPGVAPVLARAASPWKPIATLLLVLGGSAYLLARSRKSRSSLRH